MGKKEIAIKPLSFDDLLVFLKRIARFRDPFEKYERIYKGILQKGIIEPKIGIKNYYGYPLGTICFLTQQIWNTSVKNLYRAKDYNYKEDYNINLYLAYEDIKVFNARSLIKDIVDSHNLIVELRPGCLKSLFNLKQNEDQIKCQLNEILKQNYFNIENIGFDIRNIKNTDFFSKIYISYILSYPLNINSFLEYLIKEQKNFNVAIPELVQRIVLTKSMIDSLLTHDDLPDIIERLEYIYERLEKYSKEKKADFCAKLLVIVEGSTEELLLPIFADVMRLNFKQKGIHLISSGGKNQVARIYNKYREKFNRPIMLILDFDAVDIANEIKKKLRKQDKLFVISEGEFEDILDKNLICRSINNVYRTTSQVSIKELESELPMVLLLEQIWKEKGFGNFSKLEFAKIIAENIESSNDITQTIKYIINTIFKTLDYFD